MAKRAEYEGGPWAIGGVRSQRPKVSPAERRAQLVRYCEHAQRRIDEGVTVYRGILQEYRRELLALSIALAAERRAAASGEKAA